MIFKQLCRNQKIGISLIGLILVVVINIALVKLINPGKIINFDEYDEYEWKNSAREDNLRSSISWQLNKQIQSVAVLATMLITFLGILSRHLNIRSENESYFILYIVILLNFFFNFGLLWFLNTYSSIAQIENHLSGELSKVLINTSPFYNYILDEHFHINVSLYFLLVPLSILWLFSGYYKIKLEFDKSKCL